MSTNNTKTKIMKRLSNFGKVRNFKDLIIIDTCKITNFDIIKILNEFNLKLSFEINHLLNYTFIKY